MRLQKPVAAKLRRKAMRDALEEWLSTNVPGRAWWRELDGDDVSLLDKLTDYVLTYSK